MRNMSEGVDQGYSTFEGGNFVGRLRLSASQSSEVSSVTISSAVLGKLLWKSNQITGGTDYSS